MLTYKSHFSLPLLSTHQYLKDIGVFDPKITKKCIEIFDKISFLAISAHICKLYFFQLDFFGHFFIKHIKIKN